MKLYDINFYKGFSLEPPNGGMVKKVLSSKGFRTKNKDGYVYGLKTELYSTATKDEKRGYPPGIYTVLDICSPEGHVVWNQYLFVITNKGKAYPVAEYLEISDTEWVKDAIKIVKRYFAGEEIEPIKLTRYQHEEKKSKGWKSSK